MMAAASAVGMPARAQSDGGAFDSLLKACAPDDLSVSNRLKSLQNAGWRPVGGQMDQAIDAVADALSILPVLTANGAATSRAFHKSTRANVAANMKKASGGDFSSVVMVYPDPAGAVFAHLLQGARDGTIYCSASATSSETADAFLGRFFTPVPNYFPGKGVFRTEFPKKPKSNAKTQSRILVSRLDPSVLGKAVGGKFTASGAMQITTRRAG